MASIGEAILLAFDLHAAGRLDEAETLYGRVLDADPAHPDALHLSGILLGQTGRVADGLARIERALALRPDAAEFHLNRGSLLRTTGDAGATAALRRSAVLGAAAASAALAETLAVQGRRALEAGDAAAAAVHLAEAARLRPGDPVLAAALADARFDLGDWDTAIAAHRAALLLHPDSHRMLYGGAVAAFNAGRLADAATAFARAAALEPRHLDSAEFHAVALFHAGRIAESCTAGSALLALKAHAAPAAPAPLAPAPPVPAGPVPPSAGPSVERTRRVIAFSLWGDAPIYCRGALENVRLAAELYPGWTCRIYHDDSVPAPVIDACAAAGAETVAMPPGSGPAEGLFWRFLAADDPTVALFLCRDADSRVNRRERAAVEAWIASGLPFHVMRDHPLHTELMLAGMWGGRGGVLPPLAPWIREDAAAAEGGRLRDQRFLARRVWPLIAGRCLVHDSAHPGHGAPFPDVAIEARFAFTHVGASVSV